MSSTIWSAIKKRKRGTRLESAYLALRDEWLWYTRSCVQTPWGFLMAGRPDMQNGSYENQEVETLRNCLASAEVFVDVGANIGYFTCLARSMEKYSIAIEPLPHNLRYLFANLRANGWSAGFEVYPLALADKPGLASLHGSNEVASLIPGWARAPVFVQRTVALSTLDILLGNRFSGQKLVVKVDVEGAEYDMLKGASTFMQSEPRPVWLVEITLTEQRINSRNPNYLKTFELFWDAGYESSPIGHPGLKLTPKDILEYVDKGVRPDWMSENFLFSCRV